MDLLTWVLISLGTIVFVSVTTVAVIARMLFTRIRRSRALSGTVLRTRARLSWGQQHEILKLRLRLNEVLNSGQAAVNLALRSDGPRGELRRLFRRIQSEGFALGSQLRLMESESDSAVLAEALPMARSRVDELAELVRKLRSAVAAGLGDLTDDTLTALRSEVDLEVAALDAGLQELRALNGNDGLSDSHRRLSMDRPYKGSKS